MPPTRTLEGLRPATAEECVVTLGATTIWTWLRKNGRRQKAPRPRHCKADGQAQADFKKTEVGGQQPPGPPVFFFDEARFGLKPVTGRLWAKKGVRPIVHVCLGHVNFHAYSAVYPTTGEDVTLFLPRVNTGMMNLFLGEPGKAPGGRRCFPVMDRAGRHRSAGLDVPENI